MRRSASTALVLGMVLLGGNVRAAEYHVAQRHAAADDKNPGTAEKPFGTINAGLSHVRPGDTLYVHQGVYRESMMLIKEPMSLGGAHWPAFPSGDAQHPIRILAWPGQKPVVKGSQLVTGWKRHQGSVWVKEDWTIHSQQVFCDGKLLQQIGGSIPQDVAIWWNGRKGNGLADMEKGSFFCDSGGKRLYVWLADGGDPNAHEMEASVRPCHLWVTIDHCHVRGLTFTHSNTSTWIAWPASTVHGFHNTLEDCDFVWCDFCGLSVMDAYNNIVRCRVNHNGNSGFGAAGRGHRILDCTFSFNNYRRFNASWHAGAMKFNGYDILFSGCTCEGNVESPGFWSDGECSNVTIENCRAMRNGGPGIMIEIGERTVLRNNLLYENKASGVYLSNSSFCNAYGNLCYRNAGAGIAAFGVKRTDGWFFDDEKTGYDPARGNVVWGNILIDNCWKDQGDGKGGSSSTGPEIMLPNPEISSNEGNLSDYNLLYRSHGVPIPFEYNWGEKRFAGLAQWQEKTGQDRHSRIARPLFADEAGYDFRPAKGSPGKRRVRVVGRPWPGNPAAPARRSLHTAPLSVGR